jgi:AcrR family transcriptional regulator
MSACSDESKAISEPLARARDLNRAGIVACIQRAVAAGELPATVIPETLAAVFDSFLLGLSTLARDGVPHATLDAAVTQVMRLWDSLGSIADKHCP